MDKQTNFLLLTSAGTFPLFNSTRGRICLRPTGTRLKCSTGLPLLLLRPGRTTQTLGRVPCPKRSNSSTLVLIVGVTLNPAERREQGGRSQQQKTTGAVTVSIYIVVTGIKKRDRKTKDNTAVAYTVICFFTFHFPPPWPQTQHCNAALPEV